MLVNMMHVFVTADSGELCSRNFCPRPMQPRADMVQGPWFMAVGYTNYNKPISW